MYKKRFVGFYIWVLLGSLGILNHSCETDPVVWIDSGSKPVVFGMFDRFDSIHYLKVGRSFGALTDPYQSSKIWDSIYPDTAEVIVNIYDDYKRKYTTLKAEPVYNIPKEVGNFYNPGQVLYRFDYQLFFIPPNETIRNTYKDIINFTVRIPGFEEATATLSMISLDRLSTPKYHQQYLYLVPDSPLRIQWDGNEWNEVDVTFEFLEVLEDTARSKKVHIQNKNFDLSPHPLYREMSITYEEFIKEVISQIPIDKEVKKRYVSYIAIIISGGDRNMVNYIKYYNGYTDFNVGEYSNIQNGYGLVASRFTYIKDSMEFDYWTTEQLLAEPRLRYLKLYPYH